MSARLLKDPATASSRIFVGHLQTDDVTKLELEEHFSKYGIVIASIINRGFGFVQFEDEQSAQKAIQNENGALFKGRRIDVRPAKKDNNQSSGNAGNTNAKQMSGLNNQFNSMNNQFNNAPDSFSANKPNYIGGNPNFANDSTFGNNQKDLNAQNRSSGNSNFDDGNQTGNSDNDQYNAKHNNNNNNNGNDPFSNPPQNRGNNQFNLGNPNRGNDQFANPVHGNQNRGLNNQFGNNNQMGNQNRPGGNQNRNQPNPGNNQNQNAGSGGGGGGNTHRARGTRGGKNRNKNNQNNPNNANNFRDRSPINRGNRIEDKINRDWDHKQGDRLRGNNFARDSFNDSGNRYDDFKTSGTNASFGNVSGASVDYLATEKNDCEIIVVNKALTKYAEDIELRLKQIGLMVDLLFPNEDVPLGRVLGNIASRGCLYAVVVTPINHEHHSLTLNILHGLPQEHRNMPVEDAINLISRDFTNYKAGGRSVPLNTPLASERHPDAIQVLLNMLADNHQLTVLQYDRVIKYLDMKREEQMQVELGDAKDLPVKTPLTSISDPKQAELQTRILNILNNSKTNAPTVAEPSPVPPPVSAPVPVPPANWGTASNTATTPSTTTTSTGVSPSPLLNDPTVQKALDSLLQGNLLKNIGDQQPPTATASGAPLFAAFSNIGRF